jgi:hypothetical protein
LLEVISIEGMVSIDERSDQCTFGDRDLLTFSQQKKWSSWKEEGCGYDHISGNYAGKAAVRPRGDRSQRGASSVGQMHPIEAHPDFYLKVSETGVLLVEFCYGAV